MRPIVPALALMVAAGCGYIGEPLPPLANVPERVNDLTAIQQDSRIMVRFTIPRLTTEGAAIKPPLQLDLRVGPGPEPFQQEAWEASARKVMPASFSGETAAYEIPSTEWIGKDVIISARTIGSNGKASGWSKLVLLPVIAPPDRPMDLRLANTEQGIRLSWQARGSEFRVFRRIGDGPVMPLADVPESPWTDDSTQFGQRYSYRVQTIVKLGDNREAESEVSPEQSLTPVDTFPPAAPAGLRLALAPSSIEVSWEPNTEADLAGYRVYRAIAQGPFEKIAEADIPAYSDQQVEHGKAYRYEITAIDRTGNESGHSTPAEVLFE